MNTATSLARARSEVPPAIEDIGPDGDAAREQFGRAVHDLNVPQYCCGGLNFGYFYDRSPIIAYDGEAPPPYTMYDFTPSTVARLPHTASSVARRKIVVRRAWSGLHTAALRPVRIGGHAGRCSSETLCAACRAGCRVRRSASAICAQACAVSPRSACCVARQCAAGRSAGVDRSVTWCAPVDKQHAHWRRV